MIDRRDVSADLENEGSPSHRGSGWTDWSLGLALIRYWLPLAVVVTVLAGLVYAEVQQALRQSANDPQIQMAEDAATALAQGRSPRAVAGSEQVDMAASLAPYFIMFDASGQPIAASVRLDGAIPTLPAGVVAYMRDHDQDRISWQPRPGVRGAAVLQRVPSPTGGFVLAGRSLREVETRETQTLQLAAAAWLAGLASLLVVVVVGWFIAERWMPLSSARMGRPR